MAIRKEVAPSNDQTPPPPDVIDTPTEEPSESVIVEQNTAGYHDSLSGRAVHADGSFIDAAEGEEPVPAHRIVGNDWAQR